MNGKNRIKKIAAIRLDRIGDLILTTPALSLLRQQFPEASISAIISPYAKEVLNGNSFIDEVIAVGPDCSARPFSILSAFKAGWMLRERKFDAAVVFSPHTNAYALSFGLGAKQRIGYTYASRRFTRVLNSFFLTDWVNEPPDQLVVERDKLNIPHEIEQNVSLVSYLSNLHSTHIPDLLLPVGEKDIYFAEEFFKRTLPDRKAPLLGFHLAVRWRRSFSNDGIETFLERLARFWKGPVLITAGPGEREWLKELRPVFDRINEKLNNIKQHRSQIILAEPFSLKQWAAFLSFCSVVVSPDTGSLHVASAMKAPTVAIMEERFFAYHSQRWAPWRVPYIIVKKQERLALDQFICSIESALQQLIENLRGNKKCQIK